MCYLKTRSEQLNGPNINQIVSPTFNSQKDEPDVKVSQINSKQSFSLELSPDQSPQKEMCRPIKVAKNLNKTRSDF